MADLKAFREQVAALCHDIYPFGNGQRPTQADLARAIGLTRTELSRRLHGTGDILLSCENARAIVRALAGWGALQTQAEAVELLRLVDCPPFKAEQWRVAPLDQLAPLGPAAATTSPHNLPLPLTNFIGRQPQLTEVTTLLGETHLLTIVGAGGVGKTRFSLELANQLLPGYAAGAWQVQLAALNNPTLVALTIAATLGVREEPSRAIVDTLTDWLRPRKLLLILDNCEHLLDTVAALCDTLLHSCPHLTILTTSREPLAMLGETIWRLPSLIVPDLKALPEPRKMADYEAIALFIQRARAARTDFRLTTRNAEACANICVRLDGIPLAIELAAALVYTMSVASIAARLADSFQLLARGNRAALPRQQSLLATIEWSYNLLSEANRTLMRRLAVLSGGWTLEAAEVVCGAEDGLDGHIELVNKSLLVAQHHEASTRYRMLETIRQFALARLQQSGEEDDVRQRHAQLFLALAETSQSKIFGPQRSTWLPRLDAEHDNFRAALSWSLTHNLEWAARMAAALYIFWDVHNENSEGQHWLERVLAGGQLPTSLLIRTLFSAANLAKVNSDITQAQHYYGQVVTLSREVDDKLYIASGIYGLGNISIMQGDLGPAQQLYEQALSLYQAIGYRVGIARTHNALGEVFSYSAEYEPAEQHYTAALKLARELGDEYMIAAALFGLAQSNLLSGNLVVAGELFSQCLHCFEELDFRKGEADALGGLASIARQQADYVTEHSYYEQAVAISQTLDDRDRISVILLALGIIPIRGHTPNWANRLVRISAAAYRQLTATNGSPTSVLKARHAVALEIARSLLTPGEFDAAWQAGERMNMDEAIAYSIRHEDEAGTLSIRLPLGRDLSRPSVLISPRFPFTSAFSAMQIPLCVFRNANHHSTQIPHKTPHKIPIPETPFCPIIALSPFRLANRCREGRRAEDELALSPHALP